MIQGPILVLPKGQERQLGFSNSFKICNGHDWQIFFFFLNETKRGKKWRKISQNVEEPKKDEITRQEV